MRRRRSLREDFDTAEEVVLSCDPTVVEGAAHVRLVRNPDGSLTMEAGSPRKQVCDRPHDNLRQWLAEAGLRECILDETVRRLSDVNVHHPADLHLLHASARLKRCVTAPLTALKIKAEKRRTCHTAQGQARCALARPRAAGDLLTVALIVPSRSAVPAES